MPFVLRMAECECGRELDDDDGHATHCRLCLANRRAKWAKDRRDRLRNSGLCITAAAHGPPAPGCGGRCRTCWNRKRNPAGLHLVAAASGLLTQESSAVGPGCPGAAAASLPEVRPC